MRHLLLLFATYGLSVPAASAADNWTFLYQKDDIKVYGDDGTPRSFRAEGTFAADMFELLAVFSDVPRRTEWIKGLTEARVIAGDTENLVRIYSRYDLPWPAADRDSVIESVIEKNFAAGEVVVIFKGVDDERTPPVDGVVRTPVTEGRISIRDSGAHQVFVRYQLKLDSGGALPHWIVNQFTKNVPVNTLTALKAQVEKTRGQYRDFILRQKGQWESPSLRK
jgi:hypothetical protein